jgi:peptidoglycan/LPS O-acetylase OafA/YrhL
LEEVKLKTSSKQLRFYEIDLLRFIAALSVVLFHYAFRGYAADNMTSMPYLSLAPLAKYGYLGVDLFFIISGFVILMTASSGSSRRFVVSRVVRLFPAFWACCTVTFIAIIIAGGTRYSASFRQYAINMTMLSEFIGVKPIDGAYWSLFVEMKFYALVFVVLLIRQIHRAKELLGFWLIVVLIASIRPIPYVDFFIIPKFAPYFIAGAMFYIIHAEGVCTYKIFITVASYIAVAREAISKISSMETHYHASFDGIVIAIILAICFLALFLVATGKTKPFASKKWLLLGALTYPLYLIHQNFGFIIFNLAYPYLNPHFIIVGTFVVVLLVAYIVNRKVESKYSRPFKILLERLFAIRPKSLTSQ